MKGLGDGSGRSLKSVDGRIGLDGSGGGLGVFLHLVGGLDGLDEPEGRADGLLRSESGLDGPRGRLNKPLSLVVGDWID